MPNRMLQYRYRGSVAPPQTREPVRALVTGTTNGQTATVRIDDVIDSFGGWWGISAREVNAMLDALPDDVTTIDLEINSPGGEASEGVAIMNALRKHPAAVNATVTGIAASAASLIAMAADKLSMAPGSLFMIHDAWSIAMGNAEDLTREAAVIDKISQSYAQIYAARAGGTAEEWRAAMQAESWYTAQEAVDAGLVDALTDQPADSGAAARFDLTVFAHAGREQAPPPFIPNGNGEPPAAQADRKPADDEAARKNARAVGAITGNLDTLLAAARTDALDEVTVKALAPLAAQLAAMFTVPTSNQASASEIGAACADAQKDASLPGSESPATATAVPGDSAPGAAMGISPDSVRMLADLAEAEAS